MVSNEIGQPGFNYSGYTNISTSDSIVHGQVKQSGAFSFVRIYESGHVSIFEVQIYPWEHNLSINTYVGSVRPHACSLTRSSMSTKQC